jgi:cobalt/nickel transport system permease protein
MLRHPHHDSSSAGGPIHHWPAGVKMAIALLLVAGILVTPLSAPWGLGVAAAVLLVGAAAGRLLGWALLRRLLLLEPLALGVACLSLLQPGGLHLFLWLVARSTLCLLTLLLLARATPFSDALDVLRRLHVPALLVTTLALMHRYLRVLLEESQRLRRARACRSFSPGRLHAWRLQAGVAGQLFVRSVDRAERVYAAMCARGLRGSQ